MKRVTGADVLQYMVLTSDKKSYEAFKAIMEVLSMTIEFAVDCPSSYMIFFITKSRGHSEDRFTIRFVGYGGEIGVLSEVRAYKTLERAKQALYMYTRN
jgi:hypothetical protein